MRKVNALSIIGLAIAASAVASAQAQAGARQGGPPPAGRGGFFPRMATLDFPTAPQTFDTIHQKIRVVPYSERSRTRRGASRFCPAATCW